MPDGLQLSARSVAGLLARIFGPAVYDVLIPRYREGAPYQGSLIDLVSGPFPEPWQTVLLNPQPLPPQESYALILADAHVGELLSLDRAATLLGGEVAERVVDGALTSVAEIEEICPRWPRWPRRWPPPPPPPWLHEEMSATALFVFAARVLAASELVEQAQLRDAMTRLGEKAFDLSMRGAQDRTSASA
jgi:hypothetical protein